MSSEHQPQSEAPDQRRQAREPAAEAVQSEAEPLSRALEPRLLSPRDPLAHTTGQPLRREAILRAQQLQGNRHVARLIAQRQEPAGDAPPAEETPAAPAGLIVDDGGPEPGPGQLRKRDFLEQLRAAVADAATSVLAGTPWAADAEPEIDRQLAAYAALDAAGLERALRRQLPNAAGVTTAAGYLPLVAEQVRASIRAQLPAEEAAGDIQSIVAGAASGIGRAASAVAGAASAVVGGIGGALSAIGAALFKRRPGAAGDGAAPPILRTELGEGQPLAGGLQSGLGAALGHDLSGVRVHTGSQAAGMVNRLNARAVTLGDDVAFAEGEYRPGTPIGDALIAHELAHVIQQRGASDVGPQRKGDAETDALEEEADRTAVGAVVALHGGGRPELAAVGQPALPRLKAGLRLQLSACFSSTPAAAPAAPAAPVSALLDSFRRDFPDSANLIGRSPAAMRLVGEAEQAGSLYGGFAEDGPAHHAWPYTVGNSVYVPRARRSDAVLAMSDFLFELNNAIRAPQFARIGADATAGRIDARQYARRIVEQEVDGMLRLGEVWFEMKRAHGGSDWNRYDAHFYQAEYQDFRARRKTRDDIVTIVLRRVYPAGTNAGKTVEQTYMEQYAAMRPAGP